MRGHTTRMRTIAALAAALVLAGIGSAAVECTPTLQMTSRVPFAVQGLNFKAREHVTVSVLSKTTKQKPVVATPTGTFRVVFDDVSVGRCGDFIIRARGARGSTALLKLPLPACIAS
jgi:hypothetical protein